MSDLDAMENAAVRACRDGGAYLREAFRAGDRDGEFTARDVKAAADRESERRMLDVILPSFPDHRVYAEESGDHPGDADSPYRWVVDPLDGTNNFAVGMPSFATSVAVLERGDPVLAAVYVPMLDDCYVARRGEGVRYDGERVTAGSDRDLDSATVGFVIGHDVKLEDDVLATSKAIRDRLEDRCKRVVDSWSPCVHWGLLARGLVDGMVTFRADEEEQWTGELFADEAGVASRSRDGCYVGVGTDDALADLWATVEPALG
ncbi:inositol monophosphatase family protein [Halorussus sp. AFM4]|uniref:inositol monophosphatase family protein n=1 Tax=Halorussus sp. AFM4 TaxID=3421651 RepID=UPI003EB74A1E